MEGSTAFSINIILFAVITIWNVAVFLMYGYDKSMAKRGRRRVSELTLVTAAFLLGAPGAFFGMRIFRHKTKHIKFMILVPLALALNVAAIITYFYLT